MKSNNALFVLGGVVVIGLLMWVLGSQPTPDLNNQAEVATTTVEEADNFILEDYITNALYVCENGKAIGVDFYKNGVILKLSDTRVVTLPQAPSASGVRFANKDESFVFWNKGDTSFIEESGKRTFDKCVEARPEFE